MIDLFCTVTQSSQPARSIEQATHDVCRRRRIQPARSERAKCDPPCCVEIIFFLASLSPILPSSPSSIPTLPFFPSTRHSSSPIIELVERGGRAERANSYAMYNSGNMIINLSDSKRTDEAKVGREWVWEKRRASSCFIRSSPVLRIFSLPRL